MDFRMLLVCVGLAATAAQPSHAADGVKIFQTQCKMCHQGAKSTPLGPTLFGVAGRSVARNADFKYSAALQAKSNERWSDQNLDRFLSSPAKFAPGSRMPIALSAAADRKAVIEHLKTLR
jgi:cytochrome c